MAKVFGPLLSQRASGSVGDLLTYLDTPNGPRVIRKPRTSDNTPAETRARYADACAEWQTFDAGDKAPWNLLGIERGMTGFNAFISDRMLGAPAPSAVAVVDAGGAFYDLSSASSVSGSAAVGIGADLLVVFCSNIQGVTCASVTYNGVPLTSLGYAECDFFGNQKRTEMLILTDPPTGTSHQLTATWTDAQDDLGFTWQSFSGVDSIGSFQTNTSPLNAQTQNPTLTISDFSPGDYAVGSVDSKRPVTAGDNELGNYVSASSYDNYVSTEYQTTDGNLDWATASVGWWAACGCSLKPAA